MAGKILFAMVLAGYPLIVYLLLDQVGPAILGILLIAILALRSVIMGQLTSTLTWRLLVWALLALAAISAGLLLIADATLVLKLYPAAMNFGLLISFAYTLFHPPSMIERFVRAMKLPIHAKTTSYTRAVTMMWCGFFAVNGTVATLIAISGSLATWTVYNGLISYVLMSTLIVAELTFRYFYKRHHGLLAHQLEAGTNNNDIEASH